MVSRNKSIIGYAPLLTFLGHEKFCNRMDLDRQNKKVEANACST